MSLLPIVIYGATTCDDTERTREFLHERGIPFEEVNIDHDRAAEQFVTFINNGYRSTPSLVIGEGKRRIILVEPSNEELENLLADAL
jgi:mycoredoxin